MSSPSEPPAAVTTQEDPPERSSLAFLTLIVTAVSGLVIPLVVFFMPQILLLLKPLPRPPKDVAVNFPVTLWLHLYDGKVMLSWQSNAAGDDDSIYPPYGEEHGLTGEIITKKINEGIYRDGVIKSCKEIVIIAGKYKRPLPNRAIPLLDGNEDSAVATLIPALEQLTWYVEGLDRELEGTDANNLVNVINTLRHLNYVESPTMPILLALTKPKKRVQ